MERPAGSAPVRIGRVPVRIELAEKSRRPIVPGNTNRGRLRQQMQPVQIEKP